MPRRAVWLVVLPAVIAAVLVVLAGLAAGTGCGGKGAGAPATARPVATKPPAATSPASPTDAPWSSPSPLGLQVRLTAPARVFQAGQPIPVRLELRHKDGRFFAMNTLSALYLCRIAAGRAEGGAEQERTYKSSWTTVLDAGKTHVLCDFDLAADFALAAPGKYTVRFPGHSPTRQGLVELPVSPALELEIVAAGAAATVRPAAEPPRQP